MFSAQAMMKALPTVVSFITDKTGIKVLRGERAMTDSTSITIPQFSEWFLTQVEVIKAIGYIYHECFHILKSNFALAASHPLKRALVGVLEDIRIELWGMSQFPAARWYLTTLVEILTDEGFAGKFGFGPIGDDDPESKVVISYLFYKLRHDLLGQHGIQRALETAERQMHRRFTAGFQVRLDALMFEVAKCQSEDDVFELADAIITMLKEEEEQARNQAQQQAQQSQGNDADGEEGSPSPAGASSANDGSGQSSSAASAAQDGTDGQQGSAQQGGSGGQGADSPEQLAAALQSVLGMTDNEVGQDLGEMLQSALNQIAVTQNQSGVPMVSMPNVYPLHLRASGVSLAEIAGQTNAIRTRTLSWMASAAQSDRHYSRQGVEIDCSRLHMAPVGGPIFCRDDDGIDLNAAISIVIDRSGSMQSRISDAVRAAVATMLAYDVKGIKTQVSVFPVYQNGEEGIAVIKRWNESPRALAARLDSLTADGGTPMSEAIMHAATSLAHRDETLKIILVVTDGEPNEVESALAMIEKARKFGLTVVALGIGCDASPVFGEKYSSMVSDCGELAGSMVRLIKVSMENARY